MKESTKIIIALCLLYSFVSTSVIYLIKSVDYSSVAYDLGHLYKNFKDGAK